MTSDGTNVYKWDAENRLVEIQYPGSGNRTEFSFDGDGKNRTIVEIVGNVSTSTRQFIRGEQLMEERDASGNFMKSFFGKGELIGSQAFYFSRNHLGSVTDVTNALGAASNHISYGCFGEYSVDVLALNTDFLYAGYFLHIRSNLFLTPFRAYSSRLGRWLSRDPVGENGPCTYTYVGNRPPIAIDSSGLAAETAASGAVAIARLLPKMEALCDCRCVDSGQEEQCKADAKVIVGKLINTWVNNWGKGPYSQSIHQVGNYLCWDWASAFVETVNRVDSEIWMSFFRRFEERGSNMVHFAARIHIIHGKDWRRCQVSIDDGFFQDGMIHDAGWPKVQNWYETYHNLVPGYDTRAPRL